MKPRPFAYVRVSTLDEAFDLLDRHGDDACLLAGGQSLLASLNMRLSAPAVLIDIMHIQGLSGVTSREGVVSIGALTRHAEVEISPIIAREAPLIAAAVPHVAHHAIRSRGTFGGSIAYADPAAEFPAVCCALEATFVLRSREGERRVAADDFFLGLFRTALRPREILTAIEVPAAGKDDIFAFDELSRRQGDYAIVGLAAKASLRNGRLGGVRLAYLGAGVRPLLALAASAALQGRVDDAAAIDAAKAALAADLDPPSDLNGPAEMKLHLARVLTGRVLARMTG